MKKAAEVQSKMNSTKREKSAADNVKNCVWHLES